jgi:hypothetical protein
MRTVFLNIHLKHFLPFKSLKQNMLTKEASRPRITPKTKARLSVCPYTQYFETPVITLTSDYDGFGKEAGVENYS